MTITHKTWALSAMTLACMQAQAFEFKTEDGLEGKISGVLTLGTQIRTKDPSPDAYSSAVSPYVAGVQPGNLAGQNGGPDLNFYKGDQISTVLRGMADIDLKKENVGFFMRASAWKDFALGENDAAYGNFPNGFAANTPLDDKGFSSSTRFSNAEIRDVFIYGSTTVADGKNLTGRLGRQVLNWGGSRLVGGGINSTINPMDFSSQFRPGAQPYDGKLPLGMLSARIADGNTWSLEGFGAYEHRGHAYPGCGTYFDTASFIAQGCDMISFKGASEHDRLMTGQYVHRTPDINPSHPAHFGLSAGFRSNELDADVKFYAMNTASLTPSYRMTVNSVGTKSDPLNSNYGLIYPENVRTFGASFTKKHGSELSSYGELAYRPNQPLSFNASDLLSAFTGRNNPNSLLALRKGILAIPVGGTFDAYDRFGVVTGSLGVNKIFTQALAAERVVMVSEVGFSHVAGLPSPEVLRFGRGTAYGAAAYVGSNGQMTACSEAVGGKQCTSDGYTTSNAWGIRLSASATYPVAGTKLTPSILLAKDIKGYSFDGTFSEGRATIRTGARAEWDKKYYADVQFSKYLGGRYNLMVDRDYLSLVAGLRF